MNSSNVYAGFASEQSIHEPPTVIPSSSVSFARTYFGWQWHWYYVIHATLSWYVMVLFWKYWWKAPVSQSKYLLLVLSLTVHLVQNHHCSISDATG